MQFEDDHLQSKLKRWMMVMDQICIDIDVKGKERRDREMKLVEETTSRPSPYCTANAMHACINA
jgi:hypothetical protein